MFGELFCLGSWFVGFGVAAFFFFFFFFCKLFCVGSCFASGAGLFRDFLVLGVLLCFFFFRRVVLHRKLFCLGSCFRWGVVLFRELICLGICWGFGFGWFFFFFFFCELFCLGSCFA